MQRPQVFFEPASILEDLLLAGELELASVVRGAKRFEEDVAEPCTQDFDGQEEARP